MNEADTRRELIDPKLKKLAGVKLKEAILGLNLKSLMEK